MSDQAASTSNGANGATAPLPQRTRRREEQASYAYALQRDAAIKGMAIWGFIGAGSVYMAHHLFPGFRRQTLALKGFITTGVAIFGLCTGAEAVLQGHETQQRNEENLIRNRARSHLGSQGIVASEAEIEKWKSEERDKLIKRLTEERSKREAEK